MNIIRAMCSSESEYRGFKIGFIALPFIMILGLVIVFFLVSECNGFTLDATNTAEFILGGVSSLAVHEAGHWAMLEYYDRDYKFFFRHGYHPTFIYHGGVRNEIQMSGLTATMILDEGVALLTRKKRRNFWRGYLFFSGINQIAYPLLRYNGGDFGYMKGREKTIFAAICVAHGLFDMFRLYRDDQMNISSWIGVDRKGTAMGGFKIQW